MKVKVNGIQLTGVLEQLANEVDWLADKDGQINLRDFAEISRDLLIEIVDNLKAKNRLRYFGPKTRAALLEYHKQLKAGDSK
jgi:hypothetical protein